MTNFLPVNLENFTHSTYSFILHSGKFIEIYWKFLWAAVANPIQIWVSTPAGNYELESQSETCCIARRKLVLQEKKSSALSDKRQHIVGVVPFKNYFFFHLVLTWFSVRLTGLLLKTFRSYFILLKLKKQCFFLHQLIRRKKFEVLSILNMMKAFVGALP